MDKEEIQKFVDEEINPGLSMHGGHLSVSEYDSDNQVLKIELSGGCQGCAAASLTLKFTVESLLKDRFPELKEIEDVTDHYAGQDPYFN
jgi:Fe/S biogenesis protein NfuA